MVSVIIVVCGGGGNLVGGTPRVLTNFFTSSAFLGWWSRTFLIASDGSLVEVRLAQLICGDMRLETTNLFIDGFDAGLLVFRVN